MGRRRTQKPGPEMKGRNLAERLPNSQHPQDTATRLSVQQQTKGENNMSGSLAPRLAIKTK